MSKKYSLQIVFVGGPLFGFLYWRAVPETIGLFYAIVVGVVMMALVAAIQQVIGTQGWLRQIAVAIAAGTIIGTVIWWLTGHHLRWHYFVIPCVLYVLVSVVFEKIVERKQTLT